MTTLDTINPQSYSLSVAAKSADEIGISNTKSGHTASTRFFCVQKSTASLWASCVEPRKGRRSALVPVCQSAQFRSPYLALGERFDSPKPKVLAMTTQALVAPSVSIINSVPVTTSKDIASYFHKRHDNVIQSIKNLLAQEPEWGLLNFQDTPYVNDQNSQSYSIFHITRDGFAVLAMGFTGDKAFKWKIAYMKAFNEMEAKLKADTHNVSARSVDHPEIDVQKCMLEGLPLSTHAFTPEVRDAIIKKAAAMAIEAHDYCLEHLIRQAGYVGGAKNTRKALSVIESATLGKALARLHWQNLEFVRNMADMMELASKRMQGEIDAVMAQQTTKTLN